MVKFFCNRYGISQPVGKCHECGHQVCLNLIRHFAERQLHFLHCLLKPETYIGSSSRSGASPEFYIKFFQDGRLRLGGMPGLNHCLYDLRLGIIKVHPYTAQGGNPAFRILHGLADHDSDFIQTPVGTCGQVYDSLA